ncbi:MAG: hypothetical protein COT85_06355 [Chlamydiae bacterium CG10_big_fil_rev_8_21_14_0_10_42_34]|nr:MAG: hypothetical protein COT85_06355 [Chlamydiae bacterium CG10_big_fil_rev_8_21_14_0_10_42_34]
MSRKFFSILTLLLFVVSARADDDYVNEESSCAPAKPKECCVPPPKCCWEFNPCNPKGCSNMNCGSFYITSDFIYWRAENNGFSSAYEISTVITPAGTVGDNQNFGSIIRIDPEWDRGFRFGIGRNCRYDFWDVLLNYTCYNNHAKEKIASTTGFFPVWLQDLNDRFATASLSTLFHLNMCDLEIGRLIQITRTISVRPCWGVRGGTLYQTFKNHFYNNLRSVPLPVNSEVRFNGKNNYWGLGPRVGLDAQLNFSQGFGFLSKVSGALLYGENKALSVSKHVVAQTSVETTNSSCENNYYQLVPTLQLALGLQWQTCMWCEKMFYKMSVLWETNHWWNQFNLPLQLQATSTLITPLPTVGNQPLTMEGITINFELDF